MAITLTKNQVISLEKEKELQHCLVGLGWDEVKHVKKGFFSKAPAPIDCDAAAMIVFENGTTELIYFGQLHSRTNCVKHKGDNLTGAGEGDDEQIEINLRDMPNNVTKILIGVNIFNAGSRGQSFGDVENCFIRLANEDDNTEICRYDISGDKAYNGYVSMVLGELKREDNGVFKFKALGEASKKKSCTTMFDDYI